MCMIIVIYSLISRREFIFVFIVFILIVIAFSCLESQRLCRTDCRCEACPPPHWTRNPGDKSRTRDYFPKVMSGGELSSRRSTDVFIRDLFRVSTNLFQGLSFPGHWKYVSSMWEIFLPMQEDNKTVVKSTTKTASVDMPKPLFIEPVKCMMTTSLYLTEKKCMCLAYRPHTPA